MSFYFNMQDATTKSVNEWRWYLITALPVQWSWTAWWTFILVLTCKKNKLVWTRMYTPHPTWTLTGWLKFPSTPPTTNLYGIFRFLEVIYPTLNNNVWYRWNFTLQKSSPILFCLPQCTYQNPIHFLILLSMSKMIDTGAVCLSKAPVPSYTQLNKAPVPWYTEHNKVMCFVKLWLHLWKNPVCLITTAVSY